jgi:hypothetical protein
MLGLYAATPQGNDAERRIDALLARMTLEEKLGQTSQPVGVPAILPSIMISCNW